jgi:hypothetical protein
MKTSDIHGIVIPDTKYADDEWEKSGLCLTVAEKPASMELSLADATQ